MNAEKTSGQNSGNKGKMDFRKILEKKEIHKEVLKRRPNIYLEYIQTEVKMFFSQVFETEYEDENEVSLHIPYCFPSFTEEKDILKLVLLSKAFTLLWILDDLIENNPGMCNHWKNLYSGVEKPNSEVKLEKAFVLIVDKLKSTMTDTQFDRYMKMMVEGFESSKTTDLLEKRKMFVTEQEFFDFLNKEGVLEICYLFAEYMLDLDISKEQLENHLIKEYHRLFSNHVVIFNDLFSYAREKAMGKPLNYINLFKTADKSDEQLIEQLIDWGQKTNEKLLNHREIIIKGIPNFSFKYLNAIIDFAYGDYIWANVCRRYNGSSFKDTRSE